MNEQFNVATQPFNETISGIRLFLLKKSTQEKCWRVFMEQIYIVWHNKDGEVLLCDSEEEAQRILPTIQIKHPDAFILYPTDDPTESQRSKS